MAGHDYVNVQWGGPFAAMTFQSRWQSDVRNSPFILVSAPALGPPFAMFTNTGKEPLYQPTVPYHNETFVIGAPFTTVTTTYNFQVTTPISNGNGVITVVSGSDGSVFWSSNGGPGDAGDINSAAAYYLSNGWNTFASQQTGQSTHNTPGPKVYTELDNAVFLFNINAIKNALGPKVTSISIDFDTGDGPPPLTHYQSLIAYVWTATFYTFKHGR